MKRVYFSGQSKNEVFHTPWTQWSLFLADATLPTTEEKIVVKYYSHGTHIHNKKKKILLLQAKRRAGVKPSPQSCREVSLIALRKFSPSVKLYLKLRPRETYSHQSSRLRAFWGLVSRAVSGALFSPGTETGAQGRYKYLP